MSAREKIAAVKTKIAALQQSLVELEIQAANEVDTSALTAGDRIAFVYGRGEKRREAAGVVLAVKREEKKAGVVRVQIGEGFEAEIATIYEADIRSVNGVGAAPLE